MYMFTNNIIYFEIIKYLKQILNLNDMEYAIIIILLSTDEKYT